MLELDYNLAELPSSQHRAGLAGLVLMIRWLKRQPNQKGVCEITRLDENGATLKIDQEGLQVLFDEIYAASLEEQERDNVIKNQKTKQIKPPKREGTRTLTDPETGKSKEKKFYVYDVVIPRGAFLADFDPSSDGKDGLWIKLWRDMIWGILRGVPATRRPYEERAEGDFSEDADKVWQELNRAADFTVDLPSTYFIGAQASNAENVPFKDRARFQFLLHFWAFVTQIYVPTTLAYDSKTKKDKTEFVGYALTVPDVSNLGDFCNELPTFLKNNRGVEKFGYRPRDSVIDLAAEGALDLMEKLNRRLAHTAGRQSVSDLILGVDVVHLEKQGNNIRLWGSSRVDPIQTMIDDYANVKGKYRHALFRRQRLLNLLNERDWFYGFDKLISTTDSEQTIKSSWFRADARTAFNEIIKESQNKQGDEEMNENGKTAVSLEELIYKLVSTYVRTRLKSKYELEWNEGFKGTPKEVEYNEKKAKVAREAFLAVRSRTDSDFIEYFAASLCSVSQFLSENGYVALTRALYEETDKVRTLTLLALSARS